MEDSQHMPLATSSQIMLRSLAPAACSDVEHLCVVAAIVKGQTWFLQEMIKGLQLDAAKWRRWTACGASAGR